MESHQNVFQLLASRLKHFDSIPYCCTISAPRDFQYNLFIYCISAKARNIFRYTMCVQRPAHFIGIHRHFQITGIILFSFQDEQCCVHQNIAPYSCQLFVTQMYHANSSQGRVTATQICTRINRHRIEHQLIIQMCINIHS
jgi:hypothetical protein